MSDEPFGRQPQPVTILLQGEDIDVSYWLSKLRRFLENQGPYISVGTSSIRIYPHAVND